MLNVIGDFVKSVKLKLLEGMSDKSADALDTINPGLYRVIVVPFLLACETIGVTKLTVLLTINSPVPPFRLPLFDISAVVCVFVKEPFASFDEMFSVFT